MRRAAEHRVRRLGRTLLPLAAALALMAATTPAPQTGNAQSQRYYADAREQLDRGDARAALIQLKNALRADPANREARLVLSTIYLQSGQPDLAEYELKQLRNDGIAFEQLLVPLSTAYLEQGKFDILLREFPAGQHQGALEGEILNMRGAAYGALQQRDRSEESFRLAIDINPRDPKPVLGLARLALGRGDFAAAEGFADQALGLQPKFADAYAIKGEAARMSGNRELALSTYDKALEINRYERAALLGRAAVRLDQNQLDLAETDVKTVLASTPKHPQAVYLKALLAAKRNDSKTALALLQGSPATIQSVPAALFLQSALRLQQKDYAQAEQGLERYLSQIPGDQRARKLLGQSYLAHEDADKAMLVLTPALDNDPHDGELQQLIVAAHKMQFAKGEAAAGLEALRKRDLATARSEFEKAVASRPDFLAGHLALAEIDIAENRLDDAKLRYDRVLARSAIDAGAMLGHANIMLRRKDVRQAENWLEKARQAHPKAPEPVMTLVDLALSRKDSARAVTLARELLAADPKAARGQQALGRALAAAGDQAGAKAALEAAVAMQPEDLAMRSDLVRYELALNQPDAALRIAEQAPAGGADQSVADVLRGDVQLAAGRYLEAESAYRAAWDKTQSAPIADRLAEARIKAQMPEPLKTLEGWVKAHPDDLPGRMRLALRYVQTADYPAATLAYETILSQRPQDIESLNNLAWLYQRSQDPRARAVAERAYALAPDNPDIADTYGWVLIQAGDVQTGLPLVQKALAVQPSHPTYRYHEAAGLVAAGKPADAKKLLEPLLNSGAPFDETAEARALLQKIGGKK